MPISWNLANTTLFYFSNLVHKLSLKSNIIKIPFFVFNNFFSFSKTQILNFFSCLFFSPCALAASRVAKKIISALVRERQAQHKQTFTYTDTYLHTYTERQVDSHMKKHTDIFTLRETDRQTDRITHMYIQHTHTHTYTRWDTDTQAHTNLYLLSHLTWRKIKTHSHSLSFSFMLWPPRNLGCFW